MSSLEITILLKKLYIFIIVPKNLFQKFVSCNLYGLQKMFKDCPHFFIIFSIKSHS